MAESRELLILRHGKASREMLYRDYDRPLTRRGRENAASMARWILGNIGQPDYILSSSAERAEQTARIVADNLGVSGDVLHFDRQLYLAESVRLKAAVEAVPGGARRILLVGHNPGLEDLFEYLTDDYSQTGDDGKLLTTAALAWLTIPGPGKRLSGGDAELIKLIRPKWL